MVSSVNKSGPMLVPCQMPQCSISRICRSISSKMSSIMTRVSQDWNNTLDHLLPRNPLTLRRQFVVMPLRAEFTLGRLAELQEPACVMGTKEFTALEKSTSRVFASLQSVLPTYKGMSWPASLRFCEKSANNAYCAPGCKVTVYTGIQKTIQKHLSTMKTLDVVDANGKKVKLDVSDVKYEDVMAALLGHELTHGVARHSGARIAFGVFLSGILLVSSFVLKAIAKAFFTEAKPTSNPHNEKREEQVKQAKTLHTHRFTLVGSLLNVFASLTAHAGTRDLIRDAITQSHSRSNEYEADKFGMKLAHEAGFNAKGALVLMEIFRKEGFDPENRVLRTLLSLISSHPLSRDRLEANYQTYLELSAKAPLRAAAAAA